MLFSKKYFNRSINFSYVAPQQARKKIIIIIDIFGFYIGMTYNIYNFAIPKTHKARKYEDYN